MGLSMGNSLLELHEIYTFRNYQYIFLVLTIVIVVKTFTFITIKTTMFVGYADKVVSSTKEIVDKYLIRERYDFLMG